MSSNHINEICLTKIIESLEENYVLSELKVDIIVQKGKPWWDTKPLTRTFNSQSLRSMFEFFICKE
jgi:hypothetical protein